VQEGSGGGILLAFGGQFTVFIKISAFMGWEPIVRITPLLSDII
jgi:hypothetical protein